MNTMSRLVKIALLVAAIFACVVACLFSCVTGGFLLKPLLFTTTPTPVLTPVPTPTATTTVPAPAAIPTHSVYLKVDGGGIPPWGYGPFGLLGVDYPDVGPGEMVPPGPSELKTDFNGRNWRPEGCFTWALPPDAIGVYVTVQGDSPAEVRLWRGTIQACTGPEISRRAPLSVEGQSPPPTGSTGFSLIVYTVAETN